jgi:heterodisulfide reductase subunit B
MTTGNGNGDNNGGERFTGHGAEWTDANLSEKDAQVATVWVEQIVNKRSMLTNKDRVEDVRDRDAMWELEKDGEIVVHRVTDEHAPVTVKTLYGWDKKIPTTQLWHHKSCGQCGNIPYGMELPRFGHRQHREPGGCIPAELPSSLRLRESAGVAGWLLLPAGALRHAKLRERVKTILGKLGRLVDGKLLIPEEVVHYSEWVHVMRDRIKEHQVIDCSNIRATVHPACHVYKMVPEDAIYDDDILEGNRVAVTTGVLETLGTQVIDYSTWYDCCGFGFRHIISEREFTRSFAIDRKLRVAQEEARADMMVGHDTGCITTLDKNQWIGAAVGKPVELPVLADIQFAALVCGAHPYKIVQSHWHASPTEQLMEKLGIDWQAKKAEFEQGRDPLRPAFDDYIGPRLQSHRE